MLHYWHYPVSCPDSLNRLGLSAVMYEPWHFFLSLSSIVIMTLGCSFMVGG